VGRLRTYNPRWIFEDRGDYDHQRSAANIQDIEANPVKEILLSLKRIGSIGIDSKTMSIIA
jgi:hypothetical protein